MLGFLSRHQDLALFHYCHVRPVRFPYRSSSFFRVITMNPFLIPQEGFGPYNSVPASFLPGSTIASFPSNLIWPATQSIQTLLSVSGVSSFLEHSHIKLEVTWLNRGALVVAWRRCYYPLIQSTFYNDFGIRCLFCEGFISVPDNKLLV